MRDLVKILHATHWRVPSDQGPAPASWHVVSAGNESVGGDPTSDTLELARSTDEEKQSQLKRLHAFHSRHAAKAPDMLEKLKQAVIHNSNVFDALMEAVRVCSLGQITSALFEVSGQYRRNM